MGSLCQVAVLAYVVTLVLSHGIQAAVPNVPPFMGSGLKAWDNPTAAACPGGVYQSGYVLVSGEAWWRRELLPPNGFGDSSDFGHLHNEVCIPHMVVPLTNSLNITSKIFQNPGTVIEVELQDLITFSDASGVMTSSRLNRNAINANTSGGVTVNATTNETKWTDLLAYDPSNFIGSGMQPLRSGVITTEPEMTPAGQRQQKAHVSYYILVDNSNGKPPNVANPLDPMQNRIQVVGWGTITKYVVVEAYQPPKFPIGGVWRFMMRVTAGPASLPITRHILTFNPNFHDLIPGTVVMNTTGSFPTRQVNLNVHRVLGPAASGWQRVIMQGKTLSTDGSTNTGSLGMQIQVSNGSDCARGAVQTHATSDASLYIKKTLDANNKMVSWNLSRKDNNAQYNYLTPVVSNSANSIHQQVVELTYDLTFLDAKQGISAASIWLYIKSNTGAVGRTIYAFDVSSYGSDSIPCIDPSTCTPLTSSSLPQSYNWVEIPITNATFLSSALAAKTLRVWLVLAQADSPSSQVYIHSASYYGTPPLLITPSC